MVETKAPRRSQDATIATAMGNHAYRTRKVSRSGGVCASAEATRMVSAAPMRVPGRAMSVVSLEPERMDPGRWRTERGEDAEVAGAVGDRGEPLNGPQAQAGKEDGSGEGGNQCGQDHQTGV